MAALFHAFLFTYMTLFPIVNPIGNAPLYLSLTQQSTPAERKSLSLHVALTCFILLLGSMLVGSYVLQFFGIHLPAVRIAGGLIVAAIGWRMLHSGGALEADTAAAHPPSQVQDSFYPLSMPLTVGPGAISTAIALGSQRPGGSFSDILFPASGALMGIVAIALTIFLCYRFADGMVAKLGSGGTNVVVRLSSFILLCIGIQILWAGISEMIGMPLNP